MEAERRIGDDVDPGMRCRALAGQGARHIRGRRRRSRQSRSRRPGRRRRHLRLRRSGGAWQARAPAVRVPPPLSASACSAASRSGCKLAASARSIWSKIGAVAGVQHDARGRQQRAVGAFVHQVAAHREDMLARPKLPAAQAAVLAQPFDRLLQVLHVGGCLLVDDDQVGHHAAGAQIFLHAQRRRDDLEIGDVADPQRKDRKVAGNARRPKCRLAAQAGRERLAPATARRGRDRAGSGRASVRSRPRRATARYGGSAPASASRTASSGARSSRDAAAAPSRSSTSSRVLPTTVQNVSDTFFLAGTRTWPAQRSDRIEHEAGAAGQPGAAVEALPASAIVRPRPRKARRSVSASVARREPELSVDEMRKLDDRFVCRALAPAAQR